MLQNGIVNSLGKQFDSALDSIQWSYSMVEQPTWLHWYLVLFVIENSIERMSSEFEYVITASKRMSWVYVITEEILRKKGGN